VDSALREIREVVSRYRVKALYFNDDCFTARRDFVREFCREYPKDFSYPFDINVRPETLNEEICSMLKQAGCRRVSMGIENGSEKFRRQVLGRRQSNESIIRGFKLCRDAGMITKSFNIVGFPYETPEIFKETIALNTKVNPDSIVLGIFEPYPGTQLAEICRQENLIDQRRADKSFMGRTDTVLNMPQFPRKLILRCFRNFGWHVYKKHSLRKALMYKIYYSKLGESLIRLIAPAKKRLRRLFMNV
jgi:radical SAM superfamily enzyme YgiQ (UPF0313 family)